MASNLKVKDINEYQYQIRAMNKTDIDIVFTLEQATWNSDSWTYDYILEYLDDPLWNCWTLEFKINTISTPLLGYDFQQLLDKRKMISQIASICIHPNYRRCGLGGILLRHMIDYTRQTGALTIELIVQTSNKNAYNLYIKHKFQTSRRIPKYYNDESHAYLMKLENV